MKVDFNNVRRQAANNYNKLARILNGKTNLGRVGCFDADEIQETMDELRHCLNVICLSHVKENPDLQEIDVDLIWFNSDEDE